MRKLITLTAALLLLFAAGCDITAETINLPVTLSVTLKGEAAELQSKDPSELNYDELHEANWGEDYSVSIKDESLIVDIADREEDEFRYDVKNGYFTGVDHGEFGGGLTFTSGDETYDVLKINTSSILELDGKLYAFTGVAHFFTNIGRVYRLEYDGRWKAKEVIDLEGEPCAYCLDGSKLYLVTMDRLLVIENEAISEILVKDAFWYIGGLYPNSILKYKGSLIIGMRGGIYAYHLSTVRSFWYPIPDKQA